MALATIANADEAALEDLGNIFRTCYARLALPLQTLVNLLASLPKKQGGERTIALCAGAYRLFLKLAGSTDLQRWDRDVALDGSFVDSAAPRQSAKKAALKRALKAEAAAKAAGR